MGYREPDDDAPENFRGDRVVDPRRSVPGQPVYSDYQAWHGTRPSSPSDGMPASGENFSWSGQAYGGQGSGGSPTRFGNNFIPMQNYLAANRTPGLTNASYQAFKAGPNGMYSKNMHALDQAIYGFYGVGDRKPPEPTFLSEARPTPVPGQMAPGSYNVAGSPGTYKIREPGEDANDAPTGAPGKTAGIPMGQADEQSGNFKEMTGYFKPRQYAGDA